MALQSPTLQKSTSKVKVTAHAALLLLVSFTLASCSSQPDAQEPDAQERLKESVGAVSDLGNLDDIRVVELSNFAKSNDISIAQEGAFNVDFSIDNQSVDVKLEYDYRRSKTVGILTKATIGLKGASEEEIDEIRDNMTEFLDENPTVRYMRPVSKEEKIITYSSQSMSSVDFLKIYYDVGGDPMVVVELPSRGRPYYFNQLIEFENQS